MLNFLLNLIGTDNKPEFEVGIQIATTELVIGFIAGVVTTLLFVALIREFRSDNNSETDKDDKDNKE